MVLDELQVDFAMKRGHEMIVDMKSGIRRDELDGIEVQMLQGQRIPKLLPIEWIDIDGGITFRYPLGGKRMLMHRLQTQQMTMFQFYTLLLAVVEALDDSRHYMLRGECFLLHEQYIFIGDNWDDAVLAYVPLRDKRMVSSAGEAVLAMAIRWVGAVEEPDGLGLQQVFQHLRGEFVSWERLRQALLKLLGEGYRAGLAANSSTDDAYGTKTAAVIQPVQDKKVEKPREEKARFEKPATEFSAISVNANESMPVDAVWSIGASDRTRDTDIPLTELPKEAEGGNGRTGWIIGAGWILAAAVIWRFLYLSAPSRTNLFICAALTLLTGAGALLLMKRIKKNREEPDESKSWRDEQAWSPEDAFVPNSIQFGKGSMHSAQVPGKPAAPNSQEQEPRERELLPPAAASPNKASTYSRAAASDATVLLGQEVKEPSVAGTAGRLPWLERQAEGEAEKIRLEQLHFIIGRSNEGVHYIDQASGISRAHVELLASEGRWSVKDMGSRNGSTLNGSTMVPYKSYPLADTDQLQLAGEQGPVYVFRAG
ncbi:DUF6382 domain-containing protein [Paenibacillus glycinis]|uniref:FHA domain-containing protein n=1 Tax=Paenibacillus glycinis TaxID=2697035 RepID=A0ABW9XZH3_9BACL|nr:DUF6382 domain-containing protein [Paenibacillus glycinis]NBD27659.1 FHA domain-containing protein [Paenibacillus glycinis]